MVIFDQLRISDDGRKLYIDVHINKSSLFDKIYLDSITIQTADKVSETCPDSPTSDYIYKQTIEGEQKELHLVLSATDFIKSWGKDVKCMKFSSSEVSTNLFFVYIACKGVPGECTPCRLDEKTTVGVTFDVNKFYQCVMGYTRELADECSVPHGFINLILLWNAFKAAIETEHYLSAIKFWKLLNESCKGGGFGKACNCGCHG